MIQKIISIFICILITSNLNAAHIIGGYISHTCRGIENDMATIDFNVTIFRDADSGGAPFDVPLEIGIYLKSNAASYSVYETVLVNLSQISISNISSSPFSLSESKVNIEKGIYTFSKTLPVGNFDYIIAVQRCCRQATVLNLINPSENGFALQLEIKNRGLKSCTNSVALSDIPPFLALTNSDENIKIPFEKNENLKTTYKLIAPFKSGGTFDATTPNDLGCCECVRPDPNICPPPFDRLQFNMPFSPNAPFGESNHYMLDEENAIIKGSFQQIGLFSYGVEVNQYINDTLLTNQVLDFALQIEPGQNTSLISVQTFLDENQNGIKDTDEAYIDFLNYQISPSSVQSAVKNNIKTFSVIEGEYEFQIPSDINWRITNNNAITVDQIGKRYNLELGISSLDTNTKVECNITSDNFVCDSIIDMKLNINNLGSESFNGTVALKLNHELKYISSDINEVYVSEDSIVWNIDPSIKPFYNSSINIKIEIPDETNIGEIKRLKTYLSNSMNEIVNSYSYFDVIKCNHNSTTKNSYSNYDNYYALQNEYIEYIIRFENETDFSIADVKITDILDENFDIQTFDFLSSSHPVEYLIKNQQVVFYFDNINLPPSHLDASNSKGFVSIRIKPKTDLPENTIVSNSATIKYDRNFNLFTNNVQNEIVNTIPILLSNSDFIIDDVNVIPNPNDGNFLISLNNLNQENHHFDIINTLGQIVYSGTLSQNKRMTLDLEDGIYFVKVNSFKKAFTMVIAK